MANKNVTLKDSNGDVLYPQTTIAKVTGLQTALDNTSSTTGNLQEQITNLKNIGRFLAIWNASTGVPTSEPTTSPYAYKTGDYYRIGVVGNKIPTGSSYTIGGTNYTTTTDTLSIGDVYYYDSNTWIRQASSGGGTVQDVQVDGTSVLNGGIANVDLSGKVSKSGDTMTGTLKYNLMNTCQLEFRKESYGSDVYNSGITYRTAGNEALCFENNNSVTSWIFRTKNPYIQGSTWNDVTPSMQIKNQKVTINKLIESGSDASYNLDVDGTANATTLYENGESLAEKYAPISHTHTKSQITDFPSSLPASDVSSWAKASTKPSYNFNEIGSRGEAYLDWGGTNVQGDVTPVGMSISNEHSANRMAFINGACISCEYSSNAGSSYTDYGYSSANKSSLFTTSYGIPIGRASGSAEYTTSSRTRITITAQNGTTGYVYTNPRKMLINISSSGGMQVLVEYRTGTNYQSSGAWTTFGTYNLSGWSGWNDIPLVLGTLGGGTTQTSNNWQLRLTFIMTSKNASYPTTATLNSIRIYGSNAWNVSSTMANTGHIYTYDINQNTTFPAGVSATSFTENNTSLANKYTQFYTGTSATKTDNTTRATTLRISLANGVLNIWNS